VGTISLSANRSWKVGSENVEVTGIPGSYLSVSGATDFVRFEGDRVVARHAPNFTTAGGDSLVETGFAGELMAFVDAVRDGGRPESSIDSAYRTMRLYEAIAASARTGMPVAVAPEPIALS
jgi:predicted dehydrogenase